MIVYQIAGAALALLLLAIIAKGAWDLVWTMRFIRFIETSK